MESQKFKNSIETNGDVHIVSHIMEKIMVSDSEAEVGSFFEMSRERNLFALPFTKWATYNQKYQ